MALSISTAFSILAETSRAHMSPADHARLMQTYWPIKMQLFIDRKETDPFDMESFHNFKAKNLAIWKESQLLCKTISELMFKKPLLATVQPLDYQ